MLTVAIAMRRIFPKHRRARNPQDIQVQNYCWAAGNIGGAAILKARPVADMKIIGILGWREKNVFHLNSR